MGLEKGVEVEEGAEVGGRGHMGGKAVKDLHVDGSCLRPEFSARPRVLTGKSWQP